MKKINIQTGILLFWFFVSLSIGRAQCDSIQSFRVSQTGLSAAFFWESTDSNAIYTVNLRERGDTVWKRVPTRGLSVFVNELTPCTRYEAYVSRTCDGRVVRSASRSFSVDECQSLFAYPRIGILNWYERSRNIVVMTWYNSDSVEIRHWSRTRPAFQITRTSGTYAFIIIDGIYCDTLNFQIRRKINQNLYSDWSPIKHLTTPCPNTCKALHYVYFSTPHTETFQAFSWSDRQLSPTRDPYVVRWWAMNDSARTMGQIGFETDSNKFQFESLGRWNPDYRSYQVQVGRICGTDTLWSVSPSLRTNATAPSTTVARSFVFTTATTGSQKVRVNWQTNGIPYNDFLVRLRLTDGRGAVQTRAFGINGLSGSFEIDNLTPCTKYQIEWYEKNEYEKPYTGESDAGDWVKTIFYAQTACVNECPMPAGWRTLIDATGHARVVQQYHFNSQRIDWTYANAEFQYRNVDLIPNQADTIIRDTLFQNNGYFRILSKYEMRYRVNCGVNWTDWSVWKPVLRDDWRSPIRVSATATNTTATFSWETDYPLVKKFSVVFNGRTYQTNAKTMRFTGLNTCTNYPIQVSFQRSGTNETQVGTGSARTSGECVSPNCPPPQDWQLTLFNGELSLVDTMLTWIIDPMRVSGVRVRRLPLTDSSLTNVLSVNQTSPWVRVPLSRLQLGNCQEHALQLTNFCRDSTVSTPVSIGFRYRPNGANCFWSGGGNTAKIGTTHRIFPNPSTENRVSIQYFLEENQAISCKIWNLQGKLMLKTNESAQSAGFQTTELDLPIDLPSGTYLIQVFSNEKIIISEKWIKL